jgi:hypothetical protein
MTKFPKLLASASVVAALVGGMTAANAGLYTDAETATPAVKAVSTSHMMIVAGDRAYNAEMSYPKMVMKRDLIDTAVSAGQFNTLATALTEAGLIDTLKGPGPFTCSPRPMPRSPRSRRTSCRRCWRTRRRSPRC